MRLEFIVMGRPVPAVRTTGRQKYICPYYKRYQIYKDHFREVATSTKRLDGFVLFKENYISFSAKAYIKGKRRMDVDNLLKSFMDACNETVWVDDSQVVKAYVEKNSVASSEEERVEVKINTSDVHGQL